MILRNSRPSPVALELDVLFSQLGMPKQVVTNQGTKLMSEVFKCLWNYFGDASVENLSLPSPYQWPHGEIQYHPQTDAAGVHG